MSNYDNRDPYNPTPNGPYDQYGNARFEPVDDSGRGPYILLAILVAIGVIGGLLYFNHKPIDQNEQAQAPISRDTTAPGPATPGAAPLNGSTATPNNPGGMSGPSTGGATSPTPTPMGTPSSGDKP